MDDELRKAEVQQAIEVIRAMPNVVPEKNPIHMRINGNALSTWVVEEWWDYYKQQERLVANYVQEKGLDKTADANRIRKAFPWISDQMWQPGIAELKDFISFVVWRVNARYYPQLPGYYRIAFNRTFPLMSYFEDEEDLNRALDRFDVAMGVPNNNEAVGDISFKPTYSGKDLCEVFDNLLIDGAIRKTLNSMVEMPEDEFATYLGRFLS